MQYASNAEKIHLVLFFTFNATLKHWDEGGFLKRELSFYHKLCQKGIKISFLTYGDESEYEYKDILGSIEIIPVYAFQKKPKNKLSLYWQSFSIPAMLADKLKKADIFKTNQIYGGWVAVAAKKLHGKPLIARGGFEPNVNAVHSGRNFLAKQILKSASRRVYRNADFCIVTTEEAKNYIASQFRINKKQIGVQSNFIDTDRFYPQNNDSSSGCQLLYVGRLSEEKNLFNVIEAISKTNYSLDLIGTGPLEDKLKNFAEKLNARCNFLGNVPNDKLPAIINNHPIFLLCSKFEGNPKALLEAMACGAAVIGSNVRGISTVIKNEENGIICEKDPESIRSAIEKLMGNKTLRSKLGTEAAKNVNENCSLDKILENEISTYRSILGK